MRIIQTTQFKKTAMPQWFDFKPTVTLFHGTSSDLVPIIKSEGIKPPDQDLREYAMGLAKHYVQQVPPQHQGYVQKRLEDSMRSILEIRKDTGNHITGSVIYLSPDYGQAAGYAKSYARTGGEIGGDIYRLANQFAEAMGVHYLPPIHDQATPVVIEVEVPHEWMMTYKSLPEFKDRMTNIWNEQKGYDKLFEKHKTQDDFMKSVGNGFEVRISQTIPPNMIVNVHGVAA